MKGKETRYRIELKQRCDFCNLVKAPQRQDRMECRWRVEVTTETFVHPQINPTREKSQGKELGLTR